MKKDYSTKTGKETSYLLSKDLFLISIDTIAGMCLDGVYESYLDVIDGEVQSLDYKRKKNRYATIYHLVYLYQGGHRIEVVNLDDILNIYNLIHRHLENINNLMSSSINPIILKSSEGLTTLAAFADELLENNINFITEDTMEELGSRQNMFTNIGISSGSFMDRYYAKNNINRGSFVSATRKNNSATQNDVSLNKAKSRVLDLD